jgi:hypothetical protein
MRLGIVAAFFVVSVFAAQAESPSFESRGYGGPLYVGPDFKSGKPSAESPRKKPVQRATRRHAPVAKALVAKQPEPAEDAAAADAVSENSSIAGAASDAGTPAGDGAASKAAQTTGGASAAQADQKLGCVKYLPAAGITASVPCE